MTSVSPPSSRRASPPHTPIDQLQSKSRSKSTSPSDDSSIDDLSFDWQFDKDGNWVRLSKGSSKSNHSSPATPQEVHLDPPISKPPSPITLNSPITRTSLSRSESAHTALNQPAGAEAAERSQARSFQRVASGPAAMPHNYSSASTSKPRTLPRRIVVDEARDGHRDSRSRTADYQEEKENILSDTDDALAPLSKRHSPPLISRAVSSSRLMQLPSRATQSNSSTATSSSRPSVELAQRAYQPRQVQPGNRASRVAKTTAALKYATANSAAAAAAAFDRISETEGSESEAGLDNHYRGGDDTDPGEDIEPASIPLPSSLPGPSHSNVHPGGIMRQRTYGGAPLPAALAQSGTRPRRSASLSDALSSHEFPSSEQERNTNQQTHSRPGTSLGLNGHDGPRRISSEDHQETDIEREIKKYRRSTEEGRTQNSSDPLEHPYYRTSSSRQSPSPTHEPNPNNIRPAHLGHKRRDSDTLRTAVQTSVSSPTLINNHHPVSRLSPSVQAAANASARHRRSPTAPESQTGSDLLGAVSGRAPSAAGKSVGADDRDEDYGATSEKEGRRGHERERDRPKKESASLQPRVSNSAAAQQSAQSRQLMINKKIYARQDLIGKGGSSRVYRVMNQQNETFALKKVSLDRTDAETLSGYMNEIALLKRLDGNNRIIRLFDSEVKPGPGGSKGTLYMIMELGEVDFAKLMSEQLKEPLNMVWVSYYWQQMLQAVQVIHDEKIVHSDLKPANFVLVRGQLKLIDFGIANAIANDTTNIQRDHQIGTVNYMSPEAIELPDGMRRLKVGRPSDVWSLGCILYQMIYGHPPFQHLSVYQKMKAIPDSAYEIDFPEFATPVIPSPRDSSGNAVPTPPKKLDHLKRPVRRDVIAGMKSCLARGPKERATIPVLMEQGWLLMRETEPPAAPKPELAPDETIINPYYMCQLLQYGIKLGGEAQTADMGPEALLREAERLVAELKTLQR